MKNGNNNKPERWWFGSPFSNLMIAKKLLLVFLLISLLPLMLINVIDYQHSIKTVKQAVMYHLRVIAENKAGQIEAYIKARDRNIDILAGIPVVTRALEAFSSVYPQGIETSEYLAVDDVFRQFLTFYKETSGFYDLFLISPEGDVVFSVLHEDDFGTNLIHGKYRGSALATSFIKSREGAKTELSDFSYYSPTRAPAAFLTAPVFRGDEVVGVVALQYRAEEIYTLVQDYTGLGETGDIILAAREGGDAVILTPLRHDPGSAFPSKAPLDSPEDLPIQNAVNGGRGERVYVDQRGRKVLAAWLYLPSLRWGVVVKQDLDEIVASVHAQAKMKLLFSLLLGLVVLFVVLKLSKSITRPIIALTETTKDIIAEGNLDKKVNVETADEIGVLAQTFNQMVSERKAAEEKLRNLSLALEQSASILMITDRDAHINYVNKRFTEVTGYTRKEVIGKNLKILQSGKTPQTYYKKMWAAITAGYEWRGEVCNLKKNGELYWAANITTPIKDNAGEITHFLYTQEDITRRKQEEEKREHLEQQLRQAQRMEAVGQLTGGIAHDFNNLLGVILGNLELLREDLGEDVKAGNYLDNCIQCVQRGAALTGRLLAFSRKQILDPKPFVMNTLIREMDGLLRRTLGETIEIETVCAGGLWTCCADKPQVENALLNMAINARDAMPKGGKLTIETANIHLDEAYAESHVELTPGQYVMLAVTDTGTGMSKQVTERAFEPFYTTKGIGEGTGLGLSMIYGFAKQSHGHVNIYSEEGKGTTIKFYLPRYRGEAVKEEVAQEGRMGTLHEESILVVEDEHALLELYVIELGSLGYTVLSAKDGKTALEVFAENEGIDLLLTDVVLSGGMSGRDIAEELQKQSPNLKVVYMSGYTENAIVHNGRLGDNATLLRKPFTLADLERKLQAVLSS
ncbi:MAG: PAS domain S-box protein [Gammaproteobacteria bacterium]